MRKLLAMSLSIFDDLAQNTKLRVSHQLVKVQHKKLCFQLERLNLAYLYVKIDLACTQALSICLLQSLWMSQMCVS